MGIHLKTTMVFGVFDCFHQGHRFFLEKAAEKGGRLIAVIMPDKVVSEIKGRLPNDSFEKRKKRVEKEKIVDQVVAGDEKQGSWQVLKKYRPDVIALGYDQKKLEEALIKALPEFDFKPEIATVPPHHPEKYHSRFIKRPRDTIKVFGKIQSGKGQANVLGFPTINLKLEKNIPSGIYAGRVHLQGREYQAAIYISPEQDIIEAHLTDFKSDDKLYGQWTIIEIEEKIREVARDRSLQEIKELIAKDVEKVKNFNA